jgi:segregation and condensation protein B
MDTPTRQGLEAILFLADEPVQVADLAEVLEVDDDEVHAELEALADRYAADGRGIEIRRAAGGWRMYSAAGARPVLERWALAGRTGRLTQAALETLAVIAYKQPISRQDIGDIRGVNADGAVRSLVARGFVTEVGRDDGPGQALLYGTTTHFLERLGLEQLDDLPPLTDFMPEAPAPDEPELGAIRDVRRRLAAGEELATRADPGTNTGPDAGDEEEALPTPTAVTRSSDQHMDDLTGQLERAARSAVDRLREAVSAGERVEGEEQDGHVETPASGGPEAVVDGDGVAGTATAEGEDTADIEDGETEEPRDA